MALKMPMADPKSSNPSCTKECELQVTRLLRPLEMLVHVLGQVHVLVVAISIGVSTCATTSMLLLLLLLLLLPLLLRLLLLMLLAVATNNVSSSLLHLRAPSFVELITEL